MRGTALLLTMIVIWALPAPGEPIYRWLADERTRSLEHAFPTPAGYTRVKVEADSFGAWLRGLPLRAAATPVKSFDGKTILRGDDKRLAAVAELDVGSRDLQQCADSIIRLHAEYLYAAGRTGDIAYHFTSGDLIPWKRYAAGERPRVAGNKVTWAQSAPADASHAAFRSYLNTVFAYAGTRSLAQYAAKVERAKARPGDFLVAGGSPGHAVLILDMATDEKGRRVALVGQGFMPAQDFHVLRHDAGPWFPLDGDTVSTPFWADFPWAALRRL